MSPHFASFTLTRDYKKKPERVFNAFADIEQKRRWFAGGDGFETIEYKLDLRPHGWEIWRGRHGEMEVTNNTVYFEVIENQQIICAYEMFMGAERLSVSLLTITLAPHGEGARLTLTEQGAYSDEPFDVKNREIGTKDLLEALAKEIGG
ncbi:MAG: SRPBCC domain-containing protein [Caulobacterales bacterium]